MAFGFFKKILKKIVTFLAEGDSAPQDKPTYNPMAEAAARYHFKSLEEPKRNGTPGNEDDWMQQDFGQRGPDGGLLDDSSFDIERFRRMKPDSYKTAPWSGGDDRPDVMFMYTERRVEKLAETNRFADAFETKSAKHDLIMNYVENDERGGRYDDRVLKDGMPIDQTIAIAIHNQKRFILN